MDGNRLSLNTASAMIDLKAELYRKKQQLQQSSQTGSDYTVTKGIFFRQGKKPDFLVQNKGVKERNEKDLQLDTGEKESLEKSRSVLEAKARLYEKLSSSSEVLSDDFDNQHYLVDFQQKAVDKHTSVQSSEVGDPENVDDDEEEQWVEFTDSLGRTRTCLQNDLKYFQEKDALLKETVNSSTDKDLPDLLSDDMRREIHRKKWEEEMERNINRPDVHYQNVLFDEVREHGVGYFQFSKSRATREEQMEELKTLREETSTQRARAQRIKEKRKKIMDERLKKVRERKRLRMGLPLHEDGDSGESAEEASGSVGPEIPPETETEVKVTEPALESIPKLPSVREWDIGKPGVKQHSSSVLSQEEWVEKQRQERPSEFAPPVFYEDRKGSAPRSQKPSTQGSLRPQNFKRASTSVAGTEIVNEVDTPPPSHHGIGVEIPAPPTFEYYGPVQRKQSRKLFTNQEEIEASIDAGLKYLRNQSAK